MSIARRATLACSLALLVGAGATSLAAADEPRAADEPAADATPAPPSDDGAQTAAEPIPAVPAAPPVMPETVVTPSGVQDESAAAPSMSQPATASPASTQPNAAAVAKTAAAAGQNARTTSERAREQPRAVSLGRYGAIELGRPPQAASRWRGFPISLSLRDAPLPEVLRSFARIAGVNLVLHPGLTGTVTVELHDVPWDQALYVILKTQGLAAEIDGRVWIVGPN